jgi:hypothetical protein
MKNSEHGVNYIQHLNEAFYKISQDDYLNPTHVSLYFSLFYCWNIRRFQNPFIIQRDEIMFLSKVRSKSTYHRCIRDLEIRGYIMYLPSKNAMTGSRIKMLSCSPIGSPKFGYANPKNELPSVHQRPKIGLPIEPLYKHINFNKHINIVSAENEFSAKSKNEKKEVKKSSYTSPKFIPPSLEEITAYFKEKSSLEIEAQKFFNHFESNGWKIGGRSPMKKWTAAANNWILNAEKFNPKPKNPSNLHINQDKDYNIPL